MSLALRDKSQSDLARALGVSRALISQKIRGTTSWTIDDMEKAGRYLDVAPYRFLDAHGIVADGVNAGCIVWYTQSEKPHRPP